MKIVANKYKLLEKINSGSFGSIFKAENIRTGDILAMKVEKKDTNNNNNICTLKNEAKIYQYLNNLYGFPQLKWFGTDSEHNYLAIELYLFSLNALVKREKTLDIKLVAFFGKQMMERIQVLHSKFLLHRDIKPDNFLLDAQNTLFLIDFGLCKRYDYDGVHILESRINSLVGTANYASINIHNGIEPSRRDDVESCIYIIIYMLFGKLDWEHCATNSDIIALKAAIGSDKCRHLPAFISEMLKYVRQLDFYDKPDYNYLVRLLEC